MAALVAMLALGLSGIAQAAPQKLTALDQHARWSGTMTTGAVPDPSLCTPSSCAEYIANVRLPAGSFSPPTGMLVALQWPDDQLDLGYDMDLYVYAPDGHVAGSSTDLQYSSDEAVWIQNPANGRYRIVVVPHGEIGTSPYKVDVQFERGRETQQKSTLLGLVPFSQQFVVLGDQPARPTRKLLPNLVPVPAHNFHMETAAAASFYTAIDRKLRHPPSCYPQETAGINDDNFGAETPHPMRCLRFDADLLNLGDGPYEIRAYPNNGNGTDAWQVLYRTDGSYVGRKAGDAIFAAAHGHVHFRGFDHTGLYEIGRNGKPGKLVAKMRDKGRCALDTHNERFGRSGDAPMRYVFPSTCDQNENQDPGDTIYPNAPYFRSGVSPGWNDEYPWFIPDQFIDVAGVPDGRYLIVTRVNGARNVVETNYADNQAVACVKLKGDNPTGCPLP